MGHVLEWIAVGVLALLGVLACVAYWRRFNYTGRIRTGQILDRPEMVVGSILPAGLDEPEAHRRALRAWQVMADLFGVPPGKLRPTDRFDEELAQHPEERWLAVDAGMENVDDFAVHVLSCSPEPKPAINTVEDLIIAAAGAEGWEDQWNWVSQPG